jgi:hypothetical protein
MKKAPATFYMGAGRPSDRPASYREGLVSSLQKFSVEWPREVRQPALLQRSLIEVCEPDHTSTVQPPDKIQDGRTCITSVALEAAWQSTHVLT